MISFKSLLFGQTISKEELVFLTSAWKGERFADGRPKISDSLLQRAKHIMIDDAWTVLKNEGYLNQFEGGWKTDNYIGSLVQSNVTKDTWPQFYRDQRIQPLVSRLIDNGSFETCEKRNAKRFCERLADMFPAEPPALLHGDLWSGNFMFTTQGPAVFDPAPYYGHREIDIGMSLLFGGSNSRFYDAYDEMYPLEGNWKERLPFTQLYPLLVHAVLFGGNYVQRCRQILRGV
jgi:fructosamine-3-kinase